MPAPARILIITNGALCRNPRVLKEATSLGRAGHDVTVLTVRNHAASETHDLALMQTAPFRREVIDALKPGFARFRQRFSTWAARKATAIFGWESAHGLGSVAALLHRARRLSADLTIVHNESAHAVGLRLRAEGRRVAADIEDWHSEDLLPQDRRTRPLRLLRAQEHALLHTFVHTTTTSHALADGLHARYGGTRPHVISNSFPLQPDPLPLRSRADPRPAFIWFSQRLGPGRGLEPFISAWAQTTQPSRVVLVGEPSPGYREELLSSLSSARREQITFLDCVAPTALPSLLAQHDIGLALEERSIPNRNLTITNKILQYLNAGLAVVASDTAGQREVLSQGPDAGVLVPPEQIEVFRLALDALLQSRAALAHRQAAARRLAQQVYCWEREEPRLNTLIKLALAT